MAPISALAQQAAAVDLPTSLAGNPGLDTWLRIAADGSVTLSPGSRYLRASANWAREFRRRWHK